MVMKRFEIIEKLHLSKALLKMAGRGSASPTPPLALGMLLNVCLLVLRLLFFEKFAGAPWPKAYIWYGGPTSRELRLTKFRNFYAALLAEDRFEKAHKTSMRDVT